MDTPGSMTTAPMKLDEGEEVEFIQQGMRKKWVILSRHGDIVVTNKRVGFVKAIMKSGIISGIAKKIGAKPVFAFERGAIKSVERDTSRKIPRLVISDGTRTEEFWVVEDGMNKLIAALAPAK